MWHIIPQNTINMSAAQELHNHTFFVLRCVLLCVLFGTGTPHLSNGAAGNTEAGDVDPALLLSKYVQNPSVSGSEKEAGEFFARFCADRGLHVRVFTDEEDSYNFAASLYPLKLGKPNIVFMTHIDVVPAGDPAGWTHPPFSGKISEGMVWGRGAIDNKAMGVMQVLAILQFTGKAAEADLPYNVTLLAVSGEETGGDKGARIIVDHYLEELNPIVVYGEGGAGMTGLIGAAPEKPVFGLGIAQKLRLFLAVESQVAASGHGSVPRERYPTKEVAKASAALLEAIPKITVSPVVREGLHAIGAHDTGIMRRVMMNIDLYGPLFGSIIRKDPIISSMLTNTMSLTSLTSAEGAYNQIPTHARAVFDCRLLPETDQDEFLAQLKRIVEPYEVEIRIISSSPPAPVSEQGIFYQAMEQSIYAVFDDALVVPFMFVAVNDNRFFRRKGIPAYGLLPAILPEELMESIHYFDERFPVEALHKGIEVYVALISTLLENKSIIN